ncbi:hypothetical protein BB561_005071 [Smittium simulii]|uniref:Uncharacterized protein n=1 Tax=Smittium simulii TaxID=133385 RepID=A0A2T9YCE0_9FUNG|nr:hypothetical protein BB561_005071 [Smittium simulii]
MLIKGLFYVNLGISEETVCPFDFCFDCKHDVVSTAIFKLSSWIVVFISENNKRKCRTKFSNSINKFTAIFMGSRPITSIKIPDLANFKFIIDDIYHQLYYRKKY